MSVSEKTGFSFEDISSTDSSLMRDIPDLFSIPLSREKSTRSAIKSPSSNSSTSLSLMSDASDLITKKVKGKKEPPTVLSSLKNALEINTKMRQMLQREIEKMKVAVKKNLQKQDMLKNITTEAELEKNIPKVVSNIRAISAFAAPYFRDLKRMVPPINEDARIKQNSNDVNAYLKPPRPWCHVDNQKLLDGVTTYALISAQKPYKIRRDFLKSKLKRKNLTNEDLLNLQDQIAQVEEEIKRVSESPLHELLDKLNGKIDWMTISSVDMKGSRSPEDCERLWKNFLDFSINKEAFTEEEDERLKDLAEEYKERDWDVIAEDLQTNRSAIQCFYRYQTKLNQNLTKKFFTPEEDKQLIELVKKMKVGTIIQWNKVALYMEGRTRQQIINRYERSICKVYNRGPWTPEEDALVLICQSKFGTRWAKMKPFFRRRSTYSIRERYVNALDPAIKAGCWSKDEDKKLISLIRRYGFGKWSKICKHIPGRTDNMCLVRANRLLEHSAKYYSDQGIEYNIDVYDPKLFAKILRPSAPTKICVVRNKTMKNIRETALNTCLQILEKVAPSFLTETAEDSLDFKLINLETMQRISDELHEMMQNRESKDKPLVPTRRYFLRRSIPNKRICPLVSDDEPDEPQEAPVALPDEEKRYVDDILNALFYQLANILPLRRRKVMDAYNTREKVEYTLYKSYLYKQFQCKALFDEGDDLQNIIFAGIDYSKTLQAVVSYFVQPPVYENQFIIMAPNMTTMGGMEVIEATEPRMQSMASFVNHSKMYLQYLCERTSQSPMCLQCSIKEENDFKSKGSAENIISEMQKNAFAIEETLEEAVLVETASLRNFKEVCSCGVLKKSIDSVHLLRKRLMGLFLWPALLASVKLSDTQSKDLCNRAQIESAKKQIYRETARRRASKRKRAQLNGIKDSTERKFKYRKTKLEEGVSTNESKLNGSMFEHSAVLLKNKFLPQSQSRKRSKKIYPSSNVRRSKRHRSIKNYDDTEAENLQDSYMDE